MQREPVKPTPEDAREFVLVVDPEQVVDFSPDVEDAFHFDEPEPGPNDDTTPPPVVIDLPPETGEPPVPVVQLPEYLQLAPGVEFRWDGHSLESVIGSYVSGQYALGDTPGTFYYRGEGMPLDFRPDSYGPLPDSETQPSGPHV